jgi:hypothetical protein
MRYPYICIAGIDIGLFQNLKMGSCLQGTLSVELRPLLLNKQKWNIDNHGLINLYDTYDLEGSFDSQDNSKEDFYTNYYEISKETYAIKNLIIDFKKIYQKHKDCCSINATYDFLFGKQKSVLAFSKPQESLWSCKGRINNINLRDRQWRGDFHIEAWGGELSHIENLPITDIRFYDVKNNFQPKEKEEIRRIFSFDRFDNIQGLISAGLTREFNGQRWLQINTIHPEEIFLKEYTFSCPLCSSEVIDYRKNKPTPNFPEFRCSSENCNQGNGFPWSSWKPSEFN